MDPIVLRAILIPVVGLLILAVVVFVVRRSQQSYDDFHKLPPDEQRNALGAAVRRGDGFYLNSVRELPAPFRWLGMGLAVILALSCSAFFVLMFIALVRGRLFR